jgi:hypothetical protein
MMLNPALDLTGLRARFAATGRLRVQQVLNPDAAAGIADDLARLRYMLFSATGEGVAVLDPAEVARWDNARKLELQQFMFKGAAAGKGFLYNGFKMTETWGEHAGPDNALGRFNVYLATPTMFDTIRAITGSDDFDSTFAQATCYLPGHYLTRHLDNPANGKRKFAFVWGFTRTWEADWGGLLQFFSLDKQPTDSLSPGFNTLDLFDVSHWHSVTYVAPYAQAPRLAVSGWFTKGKLAG